MQNLAIHKFFQALQASTEYGKCSQFYVQLQSFSVLFIVIFPSSNQGFFKVVSLNTLVPNRIFLVQALARLDQEKNTVQGCRTMCVTFFTAQCHRNFCFFLPDLHGRQGALA